MLNNLGLFRRTVFFTCLLTFAFQANGISAFSGDGWQPLDDWAVPSVPTVTLLEESGDHLLVQWEIGGYFLEKRVVEGQTYHRIHFGDQNYTTGSEPGSPELASLVETIRLPLGTNAKAELIAVEWVDAGEMLIFPRQPPRRLDGTPETSFMHSEKAYSEAGPTPGDFVYASPPQGWGGELVSGLSVTPLRYYPLTERLQVAANMTVRVDFAPGNAPDIVISRSPSERMRQLHQQTMLNPPVADHRRPRVDENDPIRMLFIMKEEALEIMQPLIDFHHNTGIRSDVWIVEGGEEPEDIKDEVRDRFEDGLEYLFIIGDGWEGNPDVEMNFWNPEDPGGEVDDTGTHSDFWFVCLDPPLRFDDGNNYDDHLAELAVGRLVYSDDDLEDLSIQVEKLLNYQAWTFEDQQDFEWLDRSLLVGHKELYQGEYHYIETKRFIEELNYALPAPEFLPFYGNSNDPNVRNSVIQANINDPGVGIINYRGHGSNTTTGPWNRRNESINRTFINRLENRNHPFIYVASACLNGNIATFDSISLLEAFQEHDEGGSVVIHGSVISTFTDGNHYYDRKIFQAWFDEGIYDIGYSHNWTCEQMVVNFDRQWRNGYPCIGRMNARAYIWLGDPSLEIRQGPQLALDVEIPDLLPVGAEEISATITADGEPVENARLCVHDENDEIYIIGNTNIRGEVTLDFEAPVEEIALLDWGVYYRNGIPTTGRIQIADGFGAIAGVVVELADDSPIENALITLPRSQQDELSDAEGHFLFERVPVGIHPVIVHAEGFLPWEQNVDVIEDEVAEINIALRFSELSLDSAEVNQNLDQGDVTEREVPFYNSGNGPLRWSAAIDYGANFEAFQLLQQFDVRGAVDDSRLFGVEFIKNQYYIAGSNGNGDPNYIYVLDRNQQLVERFRQPIGGLGFHDLAWDGLHLFGGGNDRTIYQLNLLGEVVGEFEGPYAPNVGLAADGDGHLWVSGGNADPIVRVDYEGLVDISIPHAYNVRGLAWYPEANDGYSLFLLVLDAEDEQVKLYKANPITRDIQFVTALTDDENESIAGGLAITGIFDPVQWTMVGMVDSGEERQVRMWHLDSRTDWLTLEQPDSGILEVEEESEITLTFDLTNYGNNLLFGASIVFDTDGIEPVVEIPLTLIVGEPDAVPSDESSPPKEFAVSQPYPNPFNAVTSISIDLASSDRLITALYDLSGRKIMTISDGEFKAGRHKFSIEANDLPSGVYIVNIEATQQRIARKVVLVR